jgi:hypothetical protein
MNLKLLLLGMFVSMQVLASINPVRCETSGDSLDSAQAIERREWAWKCAPDFRTQIKLNDKIMDENRNAREGYPSFVKVEHTGSGEGISYWKAPINRNDPCDIPAGFIVGIYCMAGCYTPEQSVWFADGFQSIGRAYEENISLIMTLDATSELKKLIFKEDSVKYYLPDLIPGMHHVLTFHMLSGGSLRVTREHPIVDSEGRMRSASSLKIGEALVMANGNFDPIVAIDSEEYWGKVYNLEVNNQSLAEKIIVAQGYLNGTVYYQNEGLREINRVIFRTNLIPDSLVN